MSLFSDSENVNIFILKIEHSGQKNEYKFEFFKIIFFVTKNFKN
jgi:hypothetical protein